MHAKYERCIRLNKSYVAVFEQISSYSNVTLLLNTHFIEKIIYIICTYKRNQSIRNSSLKQNKVLTRQNTHDIINKRFPKIINISEFLLLTFT